MTDEEGPTDGQVVVGFLKYLAFLLVLAIYSEIAYPEFWQSNFATVDARANPVVE